MRSFLYKKLYAMTLCREYHLQCTSNSPHPYNPPGFSYLKNSYDVGHHSDAMIGNKYFGRRVLSQRVRY